MSLETIVRVTITSQSLRMSQAGFGTPLIIAQHDYWTDRVKTFSDLSELTTKDEKHINAWIKENSATNSAAANDKPKEVLIPEKSALFLTAQSLLSQTPRVPKFKIGLRKPTETIATALHEIMLADIDGDFYGILMLNEHGTNYA